MSFEGVVVDVRYHYYNGRMKSIEKHRTKGKGGSLLSQSHLQEELWNGNLGLTQRKMLYKKLLLSMHLQV
jgi:hypothetical protein